MLGAKQKGIHPVLVFLHPNHLLKPQFILTRNWSSGQTAINCFQKWKEIKISEVQMPLENLPALTGATLQQNWVNLTLSINKLALWQHWRNYNQITSKNIFNHTRTCHCLPASKYTANTSSAFRRSKLLRFILIYGKYEVCLNKYLTNSIQNNEHTKTLLFESPI